MIYIEWIREKDLPDPKGQTNGGYFAHCFKLVPPKSRFELIAEEI